MKKVLVIIIALFCICSGAYCQSKDVFVYGETGVGYGTHFSYKIGINSIFETDHTISVCYYYNERPAPGVPTDYHAGLFEGLPKQTLNMVGLMFGKVIYAKNNNLRYVLKGGLAIGNAMTPVNYTPEYSGIINFGSNYSYSYYTVFNYGLVLNPSIELPLSRCFGFSFGVFSIIDPISTSCGIEANILLGKLRNKQNKAK